MTLEEIWAARVDLRLVAYRPGTNAYLPLGALDLASAIAISMDGGTMLDRDIAETDWEIGEVIPGIAGTPARFRQRRTGVVDDRAAAVYDEIIEERQPKDTLAADIDEVEAVIGG
jgi:hypothetical protein